VKELRLAKAKTCERANALLETLVPEHNRRFAKPPRVTTDCHRRLGPGHRLESILSIRSERVVSNDYVVRFDNRHFQLLRPIYPGQRGGRVVVEERPGGALVIRFGKHELKYRELPRGEALGGSAPNPPEFDASAADAGSAERKRGSSGEPRSGIPPTPGRSGRTPAELYPPDGGAGDTPLPKKRPAETHPWRQPSQHKLAIQGSVSDFLDIRAVPNDVVHDWINEL